jgi:hypothetical protein
MEDYVGLVLSTECLQMVVVAHIAVDVVNAFSDSTRVKVVRLGRRVEGVPHDPCAQVMQPDGEP